MSRRVVVTGIGVLVPGGRNVEDFWRSTVSGMSRLRPEPLMEKLGLKSRAIGPIEGFDLADYHDPADVAELAQLSRFVQLSVTASGMAGADAGLDRSAFDPERAGVVFSSAIGGTPEFQLAYEKYSAKGTTPLTPFPRDLPFYDSVFLNYTAAWTARRFDLRGPCTTLTTGCTAGLDSLGLAFEQVRFGELDIAMAGAGEAPLSGLAYATLDVIGSLAVVDGPPERASRPFDATRGGFVLGEGAASLVLEELDHAIARGARIYAEVLGFASANNAFHMSDLAPDGQAMYEVITRAFADAEIDPTEIDYVNAHGSSTPQNDLFETRALKRALGQEHAARTPISSTKSMIGHSLASASLVGATAAIGALRNGVVPPTANYQVPDPQCDLDYVPNEARAHDAKTVLVSASGFGGIHSCAVFRRVGEIRSGWWPANNDGTAPGLTRESLPGSGAGVLRIGAPGNGPNVLLLHGFAGSAEQWEPVLHHLAGSGQPVYAAAIDLPGHGANTLPVDTDTRRFVLAAMDVLGLDGDVLVVGHSFGGLLALDLAATAPRFGSVAVLGSGLPLRLHPTMAAQVVSGELDEEFLANCLHRTDARTGDSRSALDVLLDGFRQVRLPGEQADLWNLNEAELRPRLASLAIPALVLVPGQDRVVSVRKGRALANLLPRATQRTLDGADHYVHLEDPGRVSELLVPFLVNPAPRAGARRAG